jgi:hypothetical protein
MTAARLGICASALGAALLALGAPALAQRGDSGSITGYVFDQAGMPIGGVKITAVSSTQIGGQRVAYSNAEGAFRFPLLDPGVFQVKAEAPKLTTAIQNAVKVGINAPAEVNFVMEVATSKVEEIRIVERPPLVSTTSASVKEVFDIDFVDNLPHDSRNAVFNQITNYTAGTIRSGRMRGGGANQTLLTMDGFNMLRQFPTLKSSSAYEIQSAGYGPDNVMASGGVVNLTSRSGSNKLEVELTATGENYLTKFFLDKLDARNRDYFYILNPSIAGPIIKDRLWYSLNAELLTNRTARLRDPEGIQPDPLPLIENYYKGTFKLTWQVTSRNKLQSVSNFDHYFPVNRNAALGVDRDAQNRAISFKHFTGLIWESVLSDSVVFRSQAGLVSTSADYYPNRCVDEPDVCDFIPAIIQKYPRMQTYQNATQHDRNNLISFQFINRLEFFHQSRALGEHNVQIKDNLITQNQTDRRSVPGDMVYEMNGGPEALTTYYSNDPRLEPARYGWYISPTNSLRNVVSVLDSWRPTRHLTVTPGAAFTIANAGNPRGGQVINARALTPSIAAAWDATHDGRTVLRGSFNQYLDADVHALAAHNQGAMVSQRCRWDEPTQSYSAGCVYSGGASSATVGLPCGPTGLTPTGESCAQKLQIPRTWEYTLGAEREVIPGLALGLDLVYRLFSRQYETLETNRIWNQSGSQLDTLGSYRNGRAQTISDLETPSGAKRRYVGLTSSVTRREGRFRLRGSYTWSRLDGSVLEGLNNRYGDIGPRDLYLDGPLADDHRHEVKMMMSYQVNRWLSTGLRYAYYSGVPYNRLFRNEQTGQFEDYRARLGSNPGANVNDPTDDRPLRLPDMQTVNAQIAVNLQPVTGSRLELFVDILNLLALRTTTSVAENDGQDFGVTRDRDGPLRIRLGLRYRY